MDPIMTSRYESELDALKDYLLSKKSASSSSSPKMTEDKLLKDYRQLVQSNIAKDQKIADHNRAHADLPRQMLTAFS